MCWILRAQAGPIEKLPVKNSKIQGFQCCRNLERDMSHHYEQNEWFLRNDRGFEMVGAGLVSCQKFGSCGMSFLLQ